MEIGKPQIARLVLGYLRSEKCISAFNEFLITSQYLKQHAPFVKNGKYFATRVCGLTLEDIINEYTEISFIVQGKLEQTSYYEEQHKMNIVQQLVYIFDHNGTDNGQPILPTDLNTTPSQSLPGNSSPKNTPKDNRDELRPTFGECSPIEHENVDNISQLLSRTLLQKSDLPEKLAEAINSVQKTPQGKEVVDAGDLTDLDNKIKTMVERAEQDPIFDEILNEIIGVNSPLDNNKPYPINSQSHITDTTRPTDTTKKKKSTPSSQVQDDKKDNIKIKSPEKCTEIIPISGTSSNPSTSSEVIIFNGNLDTYVGKAGAVAPPQQSQIYVANTPGLLMVPSMFSTPNYFIVNSQTNSVGQPLSDTDILKMPTVILDEGPSCTKLEKERATQPPPPRKCKTLAPKSDNITLSTSTGDYLAVYKDDGQVMVTSSADDAPASIKTNKTKPRELRRKLPPRQAKTKKIISNPDEENRKSPSTPPSRAPVKKTTPRSGSHVRTLSFSTPPKQEEKSNTDNPEEDKIDTPRKSASKSLFKDDQSVSKNEKKPISAWDSDLRDLLIMKTPRSPPSTDDELDLTCEDDTELKNNAMLIEAAFKTPVKEPTRKAEEEEEVVDQSNETNKEDTPEEKEEPEDNTDKNDPKDESIVETVTLEETEVYLRNCNGPPRFKKKCNLSEDPVQKYEVEVIIQKETIEQNVGNIIRQNMTVQQSEVQVKTTSNKNIILETPVKAPPKTPGKGELTPFSNVYFEEQLKGVDILSIPTPLPITPSFPVTPCIVLNTPSHVNRPTDYSTSSSYYQPSDTEQNKSLEVMIEECKKLEKRAEKREDHDMEIEEENISDVPNNIATNLNDMKRMFNENVIGKKNLNLLKRTSSSSGSSDSSNSSYSSSSSSGSDSDSECEPDQGDTTTVKRETYSLRHRAATPKKMDLKTTKPPSATKTPCKIKSVVKEIEDKRERMMQSLKNDAKNNTKPAQKNTPLRDKVGKFCKKITTKRKSRTPQKKQPTKINEQISKLCEVENEITDDDFALHLSTDEESVNKPSTESVPIKSKEEAAAKSIGPTEKETQGKIVTEKETPSDLEAEQLVQGLKERGIHLVHKKSPKKSCTSATEQDLERDEVDASDVTNRVDSKNDNDATLRTELHQIISKNEELQNEKKEVEILSSGNADSSLDLSRNDLDVTFDIQCFEEEHLKVEFNYIRRRKKPVYDLKLLEKEMKANVYIETLDIDMERIIKCSPFETLFEFAAIKPAPSKRKKKISENSDISHPGKEDTQIKHKKHENDSLDKKEINVEKRKNTSESKRKTSETKRRLSDSNADVPKSDHSDKKAYSKNKTAKGSASEKSVIEESQTKDNSSGAVDITGTVSNSLGVSVGNIVNRVEENEVASNEKFLNVEWGKSPDLRTSDDELMNYAVLGSQRLENPESPKGGLKRKNSSSEEGEPTGKKCKTEQQQALLKKVDVDMFLNKLHGSAGKS